MAGWGARPEPGLKEGGRERERQGDSVVCLVMAGVKRVSQQSSEGWGQAASAAGQGAALALSGPNVPPERIHAPRSQPKRN